MRILLFIAFMLLSAPPVHAQETAVPLDEYDNVKPGLLALDIDAASAGTKEAGPVQNDVLTLEDIVTAYQQGKFDSIVTSVMALAEKGHPQAEEILGLMYKSGQGVPKSPDKAFLWLAKAAESGRPLAQHHLGTMYFTGEGALLDHTRALMWLQLAGLHYQKGPEKNRAIEDHLNLSAQTTRHNRDRAAVLVRDWLEKKGETRLLEPQ